MKKGSQLFTGVYDRTITYHSENCGSITHCVTSHCMRMNRFTVEADRKRIFLGRPKNKKVPKKAISFSGQKIKANKKARHFRPKTKKNNKLLLPQLWNRPNSFSTSVALSMMLYKCVIAIMICRCR